MILTFGILSLTMGICGLIFGPMAWAMGSSDLREIRAGRMDRSGQGITQAGMICGMITSIIFIIIFLAIVPLLICSGGF